ncbi:hypothetical protein MMC10_000879 [Thelotrema lepadinum]|nr:hypothetical protein [Thelotrema lepadinum]
MTISMSSMFIFPLRTKERAASTDVTRQPWWTVLETIRSHAGCEGLSWGFQLEDPSKLTVIADWKTAQSFETFRTEPPNLKFGRDPAELLSGPLASFDIKFDYLQWEQSSPTAKTASPVTELVIHYFERPVEEAQQEQVSASALSFTRKLKAELPTIETYASGWQLLQDEQTGGGDEGNEEIIVFVKLLGWPSVEEHIKARFTKAFQEQLPNLKLGAKDGEMKHVSFSRL